MPNKRLFLAGASSDVGLEIAGLYIRNGYTVLAHFSSGNEKFRNFLLKNKEASGVQADFSKVEQLDAFLDSRKGELEACEVFVNAVGLLEDIPYATFTSADLMRALSANTLSGVLLTRMMGAAMSKRQWGRIVHLSSIGVKFGGGANTFCYSFSKHAAEFFPAEIRKWAKCNVLVNVVRVGITDTRIHSRISSKNIEERVRQIPANRMATAAEMAQSIYWIGSEANTYMTGQVITIAGGE